MLTSAKKVLELTCFVMAFVLIDIDFQAFKKLKTYINMYRYFQYLLSVSGFESWKGEGERGSSDAADQDLAGTG